MNINKANIVEFSKNLYLTVDENGRQKYSFRSISTEIKKKFNKKINYSTIQIWSKKYKWNELFQQAKNYGLYKSIAEKSEKLITEQEIVAAHSEQTSMYFTALDKVFKIGYNEIKRRVEEEPERIKELPSKDLLDFMTKTIDRIKEFFSDTDKQDTVFKVQIKKKSDDD